MNRDVEPRRDDAALVQSAEQFDDDLARSVVIDEFKLSDVAYSSARPTVSLHESQELDQRLRDWSQQYLRQRARTCLFPLLSALTIVFMASARTFTLIGFSLDNFIKHSDSFPNLDLVIINN